jgi:hypothetical protein
MFYLVDNNKKIIFCWSAKCGCSHIKKIFWYLQNNNIDNVIHTENDAMKLPDDIENYIVIIFCRNPYKRIISGFLDKYKKDGQYRHLWNYDKITFSDFVDELIKNNWEMIERHHFTPQTSEAFNKNILTKSKHLICYDIEKINYEYIESIFDKKIPIELLSFKDNHIRKIYTENYEGEVYDLDINIYHNYNVSIQNFYNLAIHNKVYQFYEKDFIFFNENGIHYEL